MGQRFHVPPRVMHGGRALFSNNRRARKSSTDPPVQILQHALDLGQPEVAEKFYRVARHKEADHDSTVPDECSLSLTEINISD
ncbi:hypothetical protein NOV72_02094 [Caballeronia novacaledonica]|uniref:Uncharacterized protein n=1 Tax=Caballeronia novacaledonica TaxID=1544861 RepID=A0A2U3I3Y5_9BURK|nr:hypothetical protein NOV72_02094 [Caballeronia novacaledonica]